MVQDKARRQLSDDQYKIDDDAGEEDVEIQTMERAMELSKQYEEIKDRTVDDDTVLGELKSIDSSPANNNIVINVDIPASSSNKTFRFTKPRAWSEKYEFVRWIKHYGYDADSFPNMLKDDCEVKVMRKDNNKDYELFIPNDEKKHHYWNKLTTKYQLLKEKWKYSTEIHSYISFYAIASWVVYTLSVLSNLIGLPFGIEPTQILGVLAIGFILILFLGVYELKTKNNNSRR